MIPVSSSTPFVGEFEKPFLYEQHDHFFFFFCHVTMNISYKIRVEQLLALPEL